MEMILKVIQIMKIRRNIYPKDASAALKIISDKVVKLN